MASSCVQAAVRVLVIVPSGVELSFQFHLQLCTERQATSIQVKLPNLMHEFRMSWSVLSNIAMSMWTQLFAHMILMDMFGKDVAKT